MGPSRRRLEGEIVAREITDRTGWLAMALFGNFYAYDSIAPVAEMPGSQLGYSDTQQDVRVGTALGLMWVIQNAGIAAANLIAGWLNDVYHASASNAGGYDPMMMFFLASSAAGFLFALMLWRMTAVLSRQRRAALP